MTATVERQVLGDGQGKAGCEDPLDDGVVGGVEEQGQLHSGGARPEGVAYGGRVCVGDAHPGEDDRERLTAGVRLGGDLGGELEVGQAADREDRQLLAPGPGW